MKTTVKIIALCLAMLPTGASGQAIVKKAFDKFIDNPSVTVTENHSLEKDSKTGKKYSQSDVYRFTMPANKASLIKDIEKAFRQDVDKAYSINSGTRSHYDHPITLAVGDGSVDGVHLGLQVSSNYIYACFLDPDDQSGNYRYAYGMDWIENDGQITGTLAVTYSTTLKYRQETAKQYMGGNDGRTTMYIGDPDDSFFLPFFLGQHSSQSWFTMFMTYVSSMTPADPSTRQALASRIYELTKGASEYLELTQQDKNAAVEILNSMLSDKRYNDPVLQSLLRNSIKNLK